MFRVIFGNLFNSEADCIVVPVKCDLVLEGSLGGQARAKLGPRAIFDIKLLKKIRYGEATLIYSHGSLPCKAVILVANTWKSRIKDREAADKKTSDYLAKSFKSCFEIALEAGYKTIAIPTLSTGAYKLTFRTCFDCLTYAYDEYKNVLDLDFYISKKDTYKNYKDLIDDCCDEYIIKDDLDSIDEIAVKDARGHFNEKWFKDNEYGEVKGTNQNFVQAFSNAILISGKTNVEIYSDVVEKTQFANYKNGKVLPKREKLIALCLNMELNEEQINEVLDSIGQKLNPNIEFDRVILKCLLNNIYISDDVNKRLIEAGQNPIFKQK